MRLCSMAIVALSGREARREPTLQFPQARLHSPFPSAFLDTGFFIVGPGFELSPGSIFGELSFEKAERFVQLSVHHPHDHITLLSSHRTTLASNPESMPGGTTPLSVIGLLFLGELHTHGAWPFLASLNLEGDALPFPQHLEPGPFDP